MEYSPPSPEQQAKAKAELFELYGRCPQCWMHIQKSMGYDGGAMPGTDWGIDKEFAEYARHTRSPKCLIFGKSRAHSGNGKHNGLWAFTLTKSPKDTETVGDMLAAVRKVMQQKSCPVVEYAWYYEDKGRDENGDPIHPHIHGLYETETGGRIERKHWKRAWPLWDENKPMGAGFKGGYHRPVKDGEGYKDYIKKDGGMSESYKKTE